MARCLSDWERWFVDGRAGDREAYRRFLQAADTHLRRYFRGRADAMDAEDLIQDVLIALHQKRASYDPRYPILPWMNTIARYKWIDWLRSRARLSTTALPDELADTSLPGEPAAAHALTLLLRHLPPGQALAIRLVKLEGLSVAEASAATGQSQSLIKVNVHRGLKALSRYVDDAPEDSGVGKAGEL
ncbi:hypothetical protein B5C34_12605 [Pacificimonas flava]|uniref:RNA polymerase subunit sigma n=2 Tax=Pacificimonas TaxID=1960290 RepID=A0A219B775_9SPHN|nr:MULTISPECIES: sigma-70 family RNA polymerase sigma factor [Pacificimonas]MBZ6378493.1 sigma-70 family RNA polymerase sigma factor [Pacificimonas aurantium]OWV34215.1 hypothetical protein B5C34_12605 [Pacificimonas flava]